jgi:hypothetical protein
MDRNAGPRESRVRPHHRAAVEDRDRIIAKLNTTPTLIKEALLRGKVERIHVHPGALIHCYGRIEGRIDPRHQEPRVAAVAVLYRSDRKST